MWIGQLAVVRNRMDNLYIVLRPKRYIGQPRIVYTAFVQNHLDNRRHRISDNLELGPWRLYRA